MRMSCYKTTTLPPPLLPWLCYSSSPGLPSSSSPRPAALRCGSWVCRVPSVTMWSLLVTSPSPCEQECEVRWIGCLTSQLTIFQSYMKQKLDLRSGSHAIDISQGSLTCPSKHQHGTTLFIRWFRHTAPFSRHLRSRWGYGGYVLDLTPRALKGGWTINIHVNLPTGG